MISKPESFKQAEVLASERKVIYMIKYLFEGLILPERAQLSLTSTLQFKHATTGISADSRISIILNQVAVWVDSNTEWDIFDLRNIVKNIVQNEIAIIGYLKGHAYEVEIRRVLQTDLGIDYVFGIDIPCITERNKSINHTEKFISLHAKAMGSEGIFLHRCFNDLMMAMKNPADTGFYCYRAIESLREHCTTKYNINTNNLSRQWEKLREVAKCDINTIMFIKEKADPVRHGGYISITSEVREELFLRTWDVVDAYIENI